MKKLFRWESRGTLVAGAIAGLGYRVGINYLPGVMIIVAGFLIMGMFAELENELLEKRDIAFVGSHDVRLVALHVLRTVVLLSIGVLVFVTLGRQFQQPG